MLRAYNQSAATLNLLRGFSTGQCCPVFVLIACHTILTTSSGSNRNVAETVADLVLSLLVPKWVISGVRGHG